MLRSQKHLRIALFVMSGLGLASLSALPAHGDSSETLAKPRCQPTSGGFTCVYASKNPAPSAYKYYTGQISGGMPNGQGVLVYQNDDRYEGQVRNGVPNGRGMFLFANNDRYEGDMRNGIPNGRGIFTFVNGSRYTGEVREGHPHGKGTFVFNNGDIYAGEFYLGQAKGSGSVSLKNGTRCQGTFLTVPCLGKAVARFALGRLSKAIVESFATVSPTAEAHSPL
ncbi:MAG: hypothetical protein HC780_09170 [Leptolyngbyaceae cyanobacterium CSU_1_3]|nr:hypothetical protein [Leptolyngbyaceae cyanobacterium CSU_1_3]